MYKPRKLAWDDALTTGDVEIDAQHKFLIDTFNDLGDAIQNGAGMGSINKILGVLKFYSGWHFGKEEDCMEQYRCPVAEINKKAHMVFIEKSINYQREYELSGDSDELALKIHSELSDWIVNHILAVDGKLYPCIHNKPKAVTS
jgi:hemerythrin